jgi:hypothetical protein
MSVGVLDVNVQLQVFLVGVPAQVEVAGISGIPLPVRCEFGPTRVQPIPAMMHHDLIPAVKVG